MTIEEFQQNIDALFPVKRKSDDFRADLDDILNEYLSLIQSFDDETKSKIGNNSTFVIWDNLEKRISSLIGGKKMRNGIL